MTDPDATGPMSILRAVPPMPPPDLRPAPPPRAVLQHHPSVGDLHLPPVELPARSLHITIDRPFRTAWAVGLGLFVAGWTITLATAAIGAMLVLLALAALS